MTIPPAGLISAVLVVLGLVVGLLVRWLASEFKRVDAHLHAIDKRLDVLEQQVREPAKRKRG